MKRINRPAGRCVLIVAACGFLSVVQAGAQWQYFTNFDSTLSAARKENRIVILYTGRVQFCTNDDPRLEFFDCILKQFPQLAARSNQAVVCEQFIHAPTENADGKLSAAFFREAQKQDDLYSKYDLRLFVPTLTFLDGDGTLLNGPFVRQPVYQDYASMDHDCYEMLQDYLAANPPLRLSRAQSNLAALVLKTNNSPGGLTMFRSRYHREGGQPELFLDSGVASKRYEIGEQFFFTPRDCVVTGTTDVVHKVSYNVLTVAGQFERGKPFSDSIVLQLNGATFPSVIEETGGSTGFFKMSFHTNEYWFVIRTRQRAIADALMAELDRLRAPMTNRNDRK